MNADLNPTLTIECAVHLHRRAKGQKQLRAGPVPVTPPPGRIPRVSRLMALALRCEQLLRDGVVQDYAELARLGHVSRARITQIMNLLHLAPDLQEQLLFLPPVTAGRDGLILAQLQPLAAAPDWKQQRRLWAVLAKAATGI